MGNIDKIRAEIERLIEINKTKNGFPAGVSCAIRIEAYEALLAFLDTLSEDSDKSLEEAAEEYQSDARRHALDNTPIGTAKDAFIAGAQWQEEQFEKNRLAHCDAASQEDCDRETDFAMEIIEKEHRQPTFLDAINYGMRLQKEQKSAEWSEEDEEMLEYVIGDVNDAKQLFATKDAIDLCDKEIAWLNSLRDNYKKCNSRWKPSEWQMSMLLAVINDPNNAGAESCQLALKSLYEQLKKLM